VGRYSDTNVVDDPIRIDTENAGSFEDSTFAPDIEKVGTKLVIAYYDRLNAHYSFRVSSDDGVTWGAPFTPAALVGLSLRGGYEDFYLDGTTLYFFYVKTTDFVIRYITSSDGSTWSGETVTDLAMTSTNQEYDHRYRMQKFLGSWQFFFNDGAFVLSTLRNSSLNTGWPLAKFDCAGGPPYAIYFTNGGAHDINILNGFVRANGTEFLVELAFEAGSRRFGHYLSTDGINWTPYVLGSCPNSNIGVATYDSPVPIGNEVKLSGGGGALRVPAFNDTEIAWSVAAGGARILYTLIGSPNGLNVNSVYELSASAEESGACLNICCPKPPDLTGPDARPMTYVEAGASSASRLTPQGESREDRTIQGNSREDKADQGAATISMSDPIGGTSGYASVVMADLPLFYLRLEGDATDSSGHGHHGTAGSGVTFAPPGAVVGSIAATFSGASGGYISIPIDLSALSQFTLELWFKFASYPGADNLLAEYTVNYNGSSGGFLIDPNNSTEWDVNMQSGGYDIWSLTGVRPSTGVWHHGVFLLDRPAAVGSQIKVYFDGVLVSVTDIGTDVTGNFANDILYLMSRAGSSLFLAGSLDEVAGYSGLLSPARITAHYDARTASGTGAVVVSEEKTRSGSARSSSSEKGSARLNR